MVDKKIKISVLVLTTIFFSSFYLLMSTETTTFETGISALISQNYKVAEEAFKEAYLYGSKSSLSLIYLGHTYFLQQKYKLAKKCYAKLITDYSIQQDKDLSILTKFMYAESCVYLEDYTTAEKVYSELCNIFINSTEQTNDSLFPLILYGKIFSLFKLGKYNSVLANVSFLREQIKEKKYVLDKETEIQITYILAESWYKKEYLKNAESEFKKIVTLHKDNEYAPYANLRLTQILTKQKKFSSAETMLKKLHLDKFSKEIETIIKYNLIKLLIKQEKYPEAIKLCNQIIELKHSKLLTEHIKLDRGYCYYKTKEYSKASRDLVNLIHSKEQKIVINSLYLLGLSYYSSHKYDNTIKMFTKFLDKYSRKSNLYDDVCYWLGLSYLNTEKYQNAIETFNNLVNKKSSIYSQPAEYFIAKSYRYLKEYEIAKKILNRLLEKPINDKFKAEIILELAECYKSTFEYPIAEQYYSQSITLNGKKDLNYINANLALIDIYIKSNKYSEAEKLINDILPLITDNKVLTTAKLLLFTVKYNQKEYTSALSLAEELFNTEISKKEKYFLTSSVAKIYLKNSDYENSLKYLNILVNMTEGIDNRFVIDQKIVGLLFNLNKSEEAIKKCVSMNSVYTKPQHKGWIFFNLVKHYSNLADKQKVVEYINKIKDLKDDTALSLLTREEITSFIDIVLENDINTGIVFTEIVVKTDQLSPKEKVDLLVKVVEKCISMGQYNTGLKFSAMIKKVSSDTDSYVYSEYLIGKIYELMTKNTLAENVYKNIIEKYKESIHIPKVYISLIGIVEKQQNNELIKNYEEILLNYYPDSEDVCKYFFDTAIKYESEKNFETAIKRYSYVLNSRNLDLQATAQKKLGECYYAIGKFKEASVEFLKTIYLYPQYTQLCAEAQYMVGLCCEKLNLSDEAKKAFNNSRKNYPGTLWAQEAELKLKNMK